MKKNLMTECLQVLGLTAIAALGACGDSGPPVNPFLPGAPAISSYGGCAYPAGLVAPGSTPVQRVRGSILEGPGSTLTLDIYLTTDGGAVASGTIDIISVDTLLKTGLAYGAGAFTYGPNGQLQQTTAGANAAFHDCIASTAVGTFQSGQDLAALTTGMRGPSGVLVEMGLNPTRPYGVTVSNGSLRGYVDIQLPGQVKQTFTMAPN